MTKILIKNAKIINEEKIFESDLLIKNDIIFVISQQAWQDPPQQVLLPLLS